MNEGIVTCVVCGACAGAGSSFRRGRCSQCQADLVRRKGTRSAVWHAIVLIGGFYVAASGTSEPLGVVSFIVLSLAVFDVVFIVDTAARFRSQAGPQAVITGEAIKAHIAATGQDTDLGEVARALAPDPQG